MKNMEFKRLQLVHTLPKGWKEAISMHGESLKNIVIQNHHVIKKNKCFGLPNLTVMNCRRYTF